MADCRPLSVPDKSYIQPNPLFSCIFCEKRTHSSHQCLLYENRKLFWYRVLEERRCKNCLRFFHRSEQCYDRSFCQNFNCQRKDKHSPTLCYFSYVQHRGYQNNKSNYYSPADEPHYKSRHQARQKWYDEKKFEVQLQRNPPHPFPSFHHCRQSKIQQKYKHNIRFQRESRSFCSQSV